MPNAVFILHGKKRCPSCDKILPINQFTKLKRSFCGLRSNCKTCIKLSSKRYYNKNKKKILACGKEHIQKLKLNVLTHYGKGTLACVQCGFSDIRALSIDHIEGGGGKHRRQIHRSTYQWLVDNNYPEGFQTLCMNCQYIKREQNKEQLRIK